MDSNLSGWFGTPNFSDMTDREAGIWVITKFHEYNRDINPTDFKIDLQEYLNFIDSQRGGQIDGLGLGVKLAEISQDDADEAMYKLASFAEGRIQKDTGIFRQYLADEVSDLDLFENPDAFFTWVGDSLYQTAVDVGEGVQKTGDSVINVGKGVAWWTQYSKYVLPVAFVGGVYVAWKYYGTKVKVLRKFKDIKRAVLS